MDVLRAAVPLARLFLAAADGRLDAVVRVRARARLAHVHLVQGRLIAVDGVDGEPLGDTLMRLGALDAIRHRAALAHESPRGRVGPWLVAVGAAEAGAVRCALEAQLDARMANLLRWPEPVFELVPERVVRADECEVDADLVGCVWHGLLRLARDLSPGTLAALSGDMALELTRSGTRIALALEKSGEHSDVRRGLARAPSNEQRASRAVLRVLGAAVDGATGTDACSLLLRKQREVRRRAGAYALLDLPPHARPEQARPALRRLAQKLHPDRFDRAEPCLRAASSEVMRALSQAERELLTRVR
jgi:hypothetical protein